MLGEGADPDAVIDAAVERLEAELKAQAEAAAAAAAAEDAAEAAGETEVRPRRPGRRGLQRRVTESWVVVGLGNPGREYQRTRHNVGYLVVEELAGRLGLQFARHRRAHADAAEGHAFVGTRSTVASCWSKPGPHERSGGPVKAVLDFTKTDNLVVIHDELDIPLGALRVKHGGGDNGHNGLRSLRKSLGHGDFYRVRCGVGRPMGRQDPCRLPVVRLPRGGTLRGRADGRRAADATEFLLANGLDATQSRFNRWDPDGEHPRCRTGQRTVPCRGSGCCWTCHRFRPGGSRRQGASQ